MNDFMLYAWLGVALLLSAATLFYFLFYPQWRRRRIAARPFPKAWRRILENDLALYRRLPPELRERLHGLILVFLREKRFFGCDGLELTEAMKLLIAAQACILILQRGMHHYDRLTSILVYPSGYLARETVYDGGVYSEFPIERLGESWHNGRVILSWQDVWDDARELYPGENVTLHEFAHQLDQVDGDADGLPMLAEEQSVLEWSEVFQREYDQLRRRVEQRDRPLETHRPRSRWHDQATEELLEDDDLPENEVLDDYGAENPAEFFAVATEAFFTRSQEMQRHHPELYRQMQDFYRLDPAAWPAPQRDRARDQPAPEMTPS